MQLKQQVWVAQKEFQGQKESVLTLWCSDKARNPSISQQGFTGSQSLSGSPAISHQLHTACSCLFQYRVRIAGGKKSKKSVLQCSPLGHLYAYSNIKKQFLYLHHDQQPHSLSFLSYLLSPSKTLEIGEIRFVFIKYFFLSLSPPPRLRARVKNRPPAVQPHSGLLSGGDNTAIGSDGAGTFFHLTG